MRDSVVRRFHPQAPEPSLYLKNQGRIRFQPCTPAEELGAITQAVLWAIETLATEDLVVLTTEADPVEQSHLNGVQVELTPSWKWQDAVYPLLRRIESALGRDTDATAPIQPHTLPKLSGDSYPTSDDVSAVVRFVRSHYPIRFRGKRLEAGHYGKLKWRVGADGLSLNLALPSPGFLGNFFQSEHWADGIPKPRVIKLSCSAAKGDSESIRLVTASGFKGLEADGVILFVWSYRGDLDSNLYVGLSRARLLLCVVAEPTTIARIQSIKSPG